MSDEIPSDYKLYKPGDTVPAGSEVVRHKASGNYYLAPTGTPSIEQQANDAWRLRQMQSLATSTGQWLAHTGLNTVFPAAGAMAGGALGSMIAPGVGTAVGSAGGAMAGLKANELLGYEKPSATDYMITGGLSLAPSLLRAGVKILPGAEVGQQELGQSIAAKIPGRVLPGSSSKALYASLPKQATIALPNTAQAAGELSQELTQMAPSLRTGAMQRILTAANQLTELGSKGGIDPATFQSNVTQFGRIVRQAKQTGAIHEAAASKIYGSLLDDLEAASAKTGSQYAPMLREAADSYKRELASERLAEILGTGGKGVTRSKQGFLNTNFDQAVNKILADKDLAKWLPEADRAGIVKDLQDLARTIPQVATSVGPGITGQTFAQRALLGAGIGGAAGSMMGHPLAGGAIGVAATEGIAHLLTTAPGRMIVKALVRKGVPYDQIGQLGSQLAATGFRQR